MVRYFASFHIGTRPLQELVKKSREFYALSIPVHRISDGELEIRGRSILLGGILQGVAFRTQRAKILI